MLVEWIDKLETEQTCVAHHGLPQNSSYDRWSLAGNKAGSRWRRSGDGKMNNLFGSKNMLGGNASAKGTDIKGFSELDEF